MIFTSFFLFSTVATLITTESCDDRIVNFCDIIIVGCGSAGCTLAGRLSENPNIEVCVFERGPSDERIDIAHLIQTPKLLNEIQSTASAILPYMTLTEQDYTMGKVLGGSSSINGCIYSRGSAEDYDYWEAMGATGWGYTDVLPYFRKSENIQIPEYNTSEYHGHGGPVSITTSVLNERDQTLLNLLIQAGNQLNESLIDCNQANVRGLCIVQNNIFGGQRESTSKSFLRPVMGRKNLHVYTDALVEKVVIDQNIKAATGISVLYRNKSRYVPARREVILSAGAIESPKILMLSGIGPSEVLGNLGIEPVADLPVGKVFKTHSSFALWTSINDSGFPPPTSDQEEIMAYLMTRTGLYSDTNYKFMWFFDTDVQPIQNWPDIEILFSTNQPVTSSGRFSFLTIFVLLHPKGSGSITINNTDPNEHPILDPDVLTVEEDVETLLKGLRRVQNLFNTTAFANLDASLDIPEDVCQDNVMDTDDYWKCMIQYIGGLSTHPTTTCKMGNATDAEAVVDLELRVKGVKNLRVVDASIMPEINSGHTHAPTMMIAEKAADMIKETFSEEIGFCRP